MSNKKTDRRILRTRKLLREALMALVVEQGYESITISDITDRANVARTTFYLHFKDKEELLIYGIKEMLTEMIDQFPEIEFVDAEGNTVLTRDPDHPGDFLHIAEYADFYRVMLGRKGSAAFMEDFLNLMGEMGLNYVVNMLPIPIKPRYEIEMIIRAATGGQLAIYKWWLDNDMPYSPEEMARRSARIMMNGILWALGLDDFPLPDTLREK